MHLIRKLQGRVQLHDIQFMMHRGIRGRLNRARLVGVEMFLSFPFFPFIFVWRVRALRLHDTAVCPHVDVLCWKCYIYIVYIIELPSGYFTQPWKIAHLQMVYLLKMVICHGYVSHNQMVLVYFGYMNTPISFGAPPSDPNFQGRASPVTSQAELLTRCCHCCHVLHNSWHAWNFGFL